MLVFECYSFCFQRFIQTMRAIQGALIVASSVQIILGYSQLWGLFSRYVLEIQVSPGYSLGSRGNRDVIAFIEMSFGSCRFFSPLGMAPVVGLVGLGLFQRGFPAVSAVRKYYMLVL